jgi:ferrochelatase
MKNGRPNKLVLSFHGVPQKSLERGDPYHCHCCKTGRLLATELGLKSEQYVITFQSRFGRAEWLAPYTQPTLIALAKEGIRRVDVACPGFVSDCLETLEEIAQEGQAAFLKAGGHEPLHACQRWPVIAHGDITGNLQGWPSPPKPRRELTQARAKALGATRPPAPLAHHSPG